MFDRIKLLDLTHTLHPHVPTWNDSCGFRQEIKLDYPQGLRVQAIKMHAGVGTHIDAPSHFIEGGANVADIPLKALLAPACVIDIAAKAHSDAQITMDDVRVYEQRYGLIPSKSLVIGHTGWAQYWNDANRYRNEDVQGSMRFPTFAADVAAYLVERDVVGLAIDTLSPDPADSDFLVHHAMLGAGKYIIENIAHCDKLPPMGSYVLALPPKVKDGTESALRAIAMIPNDGKAVL